MKTAEELQKELDEVNLKNEENIKALQQKLTDKDKESKKMLAELEDLKKKTETSPEALKKIEELQNQIIDSKKEIEDIKTDKRRDELAKKYPDVVTDLLIGKTDTEIEDIVTKQRKLIAENYDRKPSDYAPVYKDRNEAEAEIKAIREDKSLDTETKFVRIAEIKKNIENQ